MTAELYSRLISSHYDAGVVLYDQRTFYKIEPCLDSSMVKVQYKVGAEVSHLKAGDVDRDQVLADLGPLDGAGAGCRDVEDLGPQTTNWNAKRMIQY